MKMMSDFKAIFSASDPFTAIGKGCAGPDLHLELSGGLQLTLKAEDYASHSTDTCEPSLSPLDLPDSFAGTFLLGEPLLRRYYTVFHWEPGAEQIGFGLAAEVAHDDEEQQSVAAAEAAEDSEDAVMKAALEGAEENALLGLLHALGSRFLCVVALAFLGTHILSAKSLCGYLESMMAHQGLLREVAEFAPAVPSNEAPEGDECVICLGCCEDTSGVPGLTPEKEEDPAHEGCSDLTCKGSPRWRRLRCGHHFHETCIFEWLQKSKQCPVCRRSLSDSTGSRSWSPTSHISTSALSRSLERLNELHAAVVAVNETQ